MRTKEEIKEQKREYNEGYYKNNFERLKQYQRKYKKNNHQKIKEKNKRYRETHKEQIKERGRRHYQKNKEKIKKYNKEYYRKNSERIKRQVNNYRITNLEKVKERKKNYKRNNKQKINKKLKKQYRNNKIYNIKLKLRTHLRLALRNYAKKRKIKKSKDYGIDWEAIIEHLKPFPVDLSKYHIDHIKPLCSFDLTNLEEIKKAFAPENHQWLLAQENLKKGIKIEKIK